MSIVRKKLYTALIVGHSLICIGSLLAMSGYLDMKGIK